MLTILGPTACGKTAFAVALAKELDGEIISADSRQVYRAMDIGTGKDLNEYIVDNQQIPYHLIDICEAGEKYNLYEYQHDFHKVYSDILRRGKMPILCGGTGLYIESVLKGFRLPKVPENPVLRAALAEKSIDELKNILSSYVSLHNTTDLDSAKRAIRAIEIAKYTAEQPVDYEEFLPIDSIIVGLDIPRDERRQKITNRLKFRLENGMLEEVQNLLNSGIAPDDLIYYGLEYKFVTLYLTGQLAYNEMFAQLETAIHQFAKRQMTWFRGMERRGFAIHWLDALLPMEEKTNKVKNIIFT
ncbi:MAG: tRNA (adenosine(37)-N6)-dimethylallyltransferase MiaA [Paludibacter sp.]|jgi:tRNA dimethylallyltransferase|nr:tRNA (adenosine(37)-N6)-dimethylallyltransferase MiaA [Paludibacter sp.]